MSRPRKPDPKYRLHRPSGKAVVTLSDAAGRRKDVYLGEYRSAASRREYRKVLNDWENRGTAIGDQSINELILAFMAWGREYYGCNSRELENYKDAFRPLRKTYGTMAVREFGPLTLVAFREQLIASGRLARTTINRRINRIKRLFAFGTERETVPGEVYHALQAVKGLALGRSAARETDGVKPVRDEHVDATLPYCPPAVAAMVQIARLTGARPGEIAVMRAVDINMTGSIWEFTPKTHKNQWRGQTRTILLGPKSQEIVRGFLVADIEAYLFSPAREREERFATMRAARRTPVQPSQVNRRRRKPKRLPGQYYVVHAFRRAVTRAIDMANADIRAKAAEEGRDVAESELIPHWHPNQLRHSKATAVRRTFGLEHAAAALGHRDLDTTLIYAERCQSLASEVAAATG